MLTTRPAGRNASAIKYDFITALGSYALARDKHEQRLVLRFLTLVTARYNWKRNELAVGQREMAQLWSVDERTVKRETAKLRAKGWLIVRRQGGRGHVTQYALDHDRILSDTKPDWARVGPDFDMRMQGMPEPQSANIVPLPARGSVAAPDLSDGSEWSLAQGLLHQQDAALYGSWIAAITRQSRSGARLELKVPSRFHGVYVQTHLMGKISEAVRAVDADVTDIRIVD